MLRLFLILPSCYSLNVSLLTLDWKMFTMSEISGLSGGMRKFNRMKALDGEITCDLML
jgi:hypothetical protein